MRKVRVAAALVVLAASDFVSNPRDSALYALKATVSKHDALQAKWEAAFEALYDLNPRAAGSVLSPTRKARKK